MNSTKDEVSSSVEPRENATVPEEWQQLLHAWRYWADLGVPSKGTRDMYESKLRGFFLYLASQHPKALDYDGDYVALNTGHIRAYLHHLDFGLHLRGGTRLSYRAAIRSFCKFLVEDRYLKEDPFLTTNIPRPQPDDVLVQPVTALDLEALLRAARKDRYLGERDVALLTMLASTGLRVAELCALQMADVNVREGLLAVHHGKGNRARIVSVERMAMRELTRYLGWRRRRMSQRDKWAEPCGSLFVTRAGGPMKDENVRNRLKTLAERAGLDPRGIHPHVFRHTAATMAADAGMTIPEMNSLFGWARDSGMAERYSRTTTAMRAIASHRQIRPLERALGRK